MQNFIICFEGTASIGKSSTIRELCRLLAPSMVIDDQNDIKEVIEYNSAKIGIASKGDPYTDVKSKLLAFQAQRCDIIVCACRTKRQTKNDVYDFANESGYRIFWVRPYHLNNYSDSSDDKALVSITNKINAEGIIRLIYTIINQ